jgi:hypothetical protein
MKYLYVPVEDSPSEVEVASESQIDQEHLQQVNDGEASIIRWNHERNRFEAAVVDREKIEGEDDSEESEIEYCLADWRWL